jgi:hypothetical protein
MVSSNLITKDMRCRLQTDTSGRPDTVGVLTEFLRMRLASGPVFVSELQAMARKARLLGNAERITHAKTQASPGAQMKGSPSSTPNVQADFSTGAITALAKVL